MSKIYNNLYLGNMKVSQNAIFFEKNQIQNVLIAASGLKRPFKGKHYMQINIADIEEELILKYWPCCMQFLDQSEGNTLVHCLGGVSRSASTVMAYVMFKENLTYDRAIKKVCKLHYDANPNTGFLKQLEFWDEVLAEYRKAISHGNKENFDMLEQITLKFIDIQQKRIDYHIRLCKENKKDRRTKKNLISDSVKENPIDGLHIGGVSKYMGHTKSNYMKDQEEYENQFMEEDKEMMDDGEEYDDYYYLYTNQKDNRDEQENNILEDNKHQEKDNNFNQKSGDQEEYEICLQQQELDEIKKSQMKAQRQEARRAEKFNQVMQKLDNEKEAQQKLVENNDEKNDQSKEESDENWFYSNVKQVTKKKNKKKTTNIF